MSNSRPAEWEHPIPWKTNDELYKIRKEWIDYANNQPWYGDHKALGSRSGEFVSPSNMTLRPYTPKVSETYDDISETEAVKELTQKDFYDEAINDFIKVKGGTAESHNLPETNIEKLEFANGSSTKIPSKDYCKSIKLSDTTDAKKLNETVYDKFYGLINSTSKTSCVQFYKSNANDVQKAFDIDLQFKKKNNDYVFNYFNGASPKGKILSTFAELYNSKNFTVKTGGCLENTDSVVYKFNNISNDYNDFIISFSKFVDSYLTNKEVSPDSVKDLFFKGDSLKSWSVNSFVLHKLIRDYYQEIDSELPVIKAKSCINFNKNWWEEISKSTTFADAKQKLYLVFHDMEFGENTMSTTTEKFPISLFSTGETSEDSTIGGFLSGLFAGATAQAATLKQETKESTLPEEAVKAWQNPLLPIKLVKEKNEYLLYVDATNVESSNLIAKSENVNLFECDKKSSMRTTFIDDTIAKSITDKTKSDVVIPSMASKYNLGTELVWEFNLSNQSSQYFRGGREYGLRPYGIRDNGGYTTINSAYVQFKDMFDNSHTVNGLEKNMKTVIFPDEPLYGHYRFHSYAQPNADEARASNNADKGKLTITGWEWGSRCGPSSDKNPDGRYYDWAGTGVTYPYYPLDNVIGTKYLPLLAFILSPDRYIPNVDSKNYYAAMPANTWNSVGCPTSDGMCGDIQKAYVETSRLMDLDDGVFKRYIKSENPIVYQGMKSRLYQGIYDHTTKGLFFKNYNWTFVKGTAYEIKTTNGFTTDKLYLSTKTAKDSPYSANFIKVKNDIVAIDDRIALCYKLILENNLESIAKQLTTEMTEWLTEQPEYLIPYRLKGYLNYVHAKRTKGNGIFSSIESPLMPGVIHVDKPILLPKSTYIANNDISFTKVQTTHGTQIIDFTENPTTGFDALFTNLGKEFATTEVETLPCIVVPNKSNPIDYLDKTMFTITHSKIKDLQNFGSNGVGLVFETRPSVIDNVYSEKDIINKGISSSNTSGSLKINIPFVRVNESSTNVDFYFTTYGKDIKILKFVKDAYSTGVSKTTFDGGIDSLYVSKNMIKDTLVLPSVLRTRYRTYNVISG